MFCIPKNIRSRTLMSLRNPVERHQIIEPAGPKTKKSKKFTPKSVGFNFAAFSGIIGMIPVT